MSWFVFNAKTKSQTEMNQNEMLDHVRDLSIETLGKTFLWQESWSDWRSVKDVPEAMAARRKGPPPPPKFVDAPEPLVSLAQIERPAQVVEIVKTTPQAAASHERRKDVRHRVRLKVIALCGEVAFRTFSEDLSISGVRLEHPLPHQMLGQEFVLLIQSPEVGANIKMKATLVGDGIEAIRFEFFELSAQAENALKGWIDMASVKKSKTLKKAA